MGFWRTVREWLSAEGKELKDVTDGLETRLSAEMDRREARLDETPAEAMERLQQEIAEGDAALDAFGDRIGAAEAQADAVADLAGNDADDDVLDLPSEEVDPGDER